MGDGVRAAVDERRKKGGQAFLQEWEADRGEDPGQRQANWKISKDYQILTTQTYLLDYSAK
jgi:hypothetical protein